MTDVATRPGAGEGSGSDSQELDVFDPRLTRFDLVRESARRDGIEIVHYEPRFPPGSPAEQRVVRTIALLFVLGGAAGLAFTVAYIWWPHEYDFGGTELSKFYTPVLGITLGLAMFFLGVGVVAWVKKLLPHEISVEQRHDGGSSEEDRRLAAATLANGGLETGVTRRPLLKGAVALGLAPIGLVTLAPLVGGLIKDPNKPVFEETGKSPSHQTGWDPALNDGRPVPLTRDDGTRIRPEDVSVGGQMTVFPGIPGGATNEFADSPTLLIHLRQEHADQLRENLYPMNENSMAGNFVAYSKICTHAGCPPSLFEQQTNRLLCPCHQSQFLITDNARPVFGPATRSLAMLPLELDPDGHFVAASDYQIPVGPSFWER
jgi:ubiquinol-cytochrome c reductase iron-sulfur subunit